MAIAYVIEAMSADGPPVYYAPDAGRHSGHGLMGWIEDKQQALGFASAKDAQRFAEALLPRTASTCRPVPIQRGE
jgi:hypothetical protein